MPRQRRRSSSLPPPLSTFDSRVQCTLTTSPSSLCRGRGPLAVQYANGVSVAVVSPGASTPLSVTADLTECAAAGDCGAPSLCTLPQCVAGCCSYVSTGRCDTEAPGVLGLTGALPSARYALLSRESAAAVQLPLLGTDPGDVLSDVSYVDDRPNQAFALNFSFPYFGFSASTLYVSPNGYVQLSAIPQCRGYFTYSSCNLDTHGDYTGVLGPLITDFDPRAGAESSVWVRQDFRSYICVNWLGMPVFGDTSGVLYATRLCVYKSGAFSWQFDGFDSPPPRSVKSWMVGACTAASRR